MRLVLGYLKKRNTTHVQVLNFTRNLVRPKRSTRSEVSNKYNIFAKPPRSTRAQVLNLAETLARPKRSQLQIQQMAFMIVAVLFFFVLVGLAFLSYEYKSINENFAELQKQNAISSLQVITDMPELTCGALCLDEDKLEVMSSLSANYSGFWPVASIKVYKVYPAFTQAILCPAPDCNFYNIYDSGKNATQYSTFVSLCKRVKENDYVYDKCEIAKLLVGVKA